MRPLSVAIDALNLGLREGTGIATYSRELVNMLLAEGHSVAAIYGLDRVSNRATRTSEFLQQLSLHGEPSSKEHKRLVLWSARYAFQYLLRRSFPLTEVELPTSAQLCTPERLPPKGITPFNGNFILRCAQAYTAFIPFSLKVRLPIKVDILHLTSPVPITIPGVRQICTIHDVIPFALPDSTNINLRHFHRMLKTTLAATDLVFAISDQTKRDLIAHLGLQDERIHVTYQAVDVPSSFMAVPQDDVDRFVEESFGLESGKYLLYFGAIEPKKNLLRLLEAISSAKVEMPLVIVGRYAWGFKDVQRAIKALEHQRTPAGRPRVLRLAYLPRDKLYYAIRGARCVLFPSLYEGFGLPALEAMQLGCPVITSNVSSLPEVCGDAALYVDPYDVPGLKDAIEGIVVNDSLIEDLRAKGLRQAEKYSKARYRDRVLEGYAKVLEPDRVGMPSK